MSLSRALFIVGLIISVGINSSASTCSHYFLNLAGRLATGERVYKPEAETYTLDANSRNDLRLLERVYPHMNTTRTAFGSARLARMFENPYMSESEIIQRQNAVREILNDKDLREALQEALNPLRRISTNYLKDNLDNLPKERRGDSFFAGTSLAMSSAMASIVLAAGSPAFLPTGLFAMMMINGQYAGELSRARWEVGLYKSIFASAKKLSTALQHSKSDALREVYEVLSSLTENSHSLNLMTLNQRLERMRHQNRLIFALDLIYAHSYWSLKKTKSDINNKKDNIAVLISALSEIDVFLAIAEYSLKSPTPMIFPTVLEQQVPYLEISEGHNPYIHAVNPEASVANSVKLSGVSQEGQNFTILTGANAGGKSTFLKMIGLMSIQAQIGAPVPAKAFVFTPVEVLTNIDISDSLETGKSFFRAESQRLAQIIGRINEQPKLLVIMDEILLGTNPKDRHAVEQEVIRYMSSMGRLALLATHDIQVTKLANEIPQIQNLQVEEIRDADGNFQFTFKIIPGVSNTTTAYEVLRAEGVPEDLVKRAYKNRLESDK